MRICGLSVPFPGAKRPLEEGAKLGMWDFILLGEEEIKIPHAEIYILAAWHPVYDQLTYLGRTGVMWTSSVGEMDLEPVEQAYLGKLINDPKIDFIWFGDPALAQVYPEKGFYAPYPFDVNSLVKPEVEKKDIATLFCPAGPKKNILNQLLAMKLVQREIKLTLHTNIQGYDFPLSDLDHVRHGWLPGSEYNELVASARVNLACSSYETFNYNVAEAAMVGTISITSPTIPLPGLSVKNINSPVHIAERIMEGVNASNGLHNGLLRSMRAVLEVRNKECTRIIVKGL